MFNLIIVFLSSVKRSLSLIFFFIKFGLGLNQSLGKVKDEYIKECIVEMKTTLADMMAFYQADCRLPFNVSIEMEKNINKSVRIAPYIQDKEFDNTLKKMIEIFPKIKYLDVG
jgi:hypothetical protein